MEIDGTKETMTIPMVNKDPVKLGNSSPDFNLGWSNTITWKDFSLYFLIDGRFGGDVMSLTEADLDQQGVSKISGDARDRGYIMLEGTRIDGGKKQPEYSGILQCGGRTCRCEQNTICMMLPNIRLRELSLS